MFYAAGVTAFRLRRIAPAKVVYTVLADSKGSLGHRVTVLASFKTRFLRQEEERLGRVIRRLSDFKASTRNVVLRIVTNIPS